MDAGHEGAGSLADAQATIARQEAELTRLQSEVERLKRRAADEQFAEDLRDALTLASTAATLGAPTTHQRLLDMIVTTAADIIGSNAASLFLIDEEKQELVFEVALGEKAEEVKKFRVPLGKGVAGLVALTGQPMAISDTANDDRDAADIAQAVGYHPKNILCVPLFYADQVIGVLELLDKDGADSFSPSDMEALGLFANQAAVAIEQSRTQRNLTALVGGLIQAVDGLPDYGREGLTERARAFTADLEQHTGYVNALTMARLVQEIARYGDDASTACRSILESFAQYLRSRPHTFDNQGSF
jgi:putative methionine-R-sulfoxide reductase with GAF domain